MADADMQALLARAKAAFDAMTPAEQEAMLAAQRESWVRGEMALGRSEDATVRMMKPQPKEPGNG